MASNKKLRQSTSGTRLMEKAEQGVSVQIICANPSKPFMEEYEELYEQMKPGLFRIYFCIKKSRKNPEWRLLQRLSSRQPMC